MKGIGKIILKNISLQASNDDIIKPNTNYRSWKVR